MSYQTIPAHEVREGDLIHYSDGADQLVTGVSFSPLAADVGLAHIVVNGRDHSLRRDSLVKVLRRDS